MPARIAEKQFAAVIATGESSVTTTVPATQCGTIHKVIAKQTGGAASAFTVEILNHDLETTPVPSPNELARVVEKIDVAAGALSENYYDHGYVYTNTLGKNAFYVKITLASGTASSDLTFSIAVTWKTND